MFCAKPAFPQVPERVLGVLARSIEKLIDRRGIRAEGRHASNVPSLSSQSHKQSPERSPTRPNQGVLGPLGSGWSHLSNARAVVHVTNATGVRTRSAGLPWSTAD